MVKVIQSMVLFLSLLIASCASHPESPDTLYNQIGGQPTIIKITDNFIKEISFNKPLYAFFAKANIARFRKHFNDYLCEQTGGPCRYQSDSMLRVHQGMYISEALFNRTVELFTKAMEESGVSYPQQNRILAILAKTRSEMLYK